ncbi:MAG: molybdopterin-dependent oxidoreductase [Actinomycetota bacterium]|nr:molybdopterin-dependent oxidoreductase [Actinomycetota bacterium]
MSNPAATTSRTVHGTCHHDCPDSCGWQVTVEARADGAAPVAVQMRGDAAHPYSQGELCPKVNRFLDRVYSPDRVLHPLRRVGAKGEGRFEQITWAEALDEIATRFHGIIAEHGAEAIMPYVSAGNQSLLAIMFGDRFWHHLGASRVVGALCGAVAGAGSATTNGTGKGIDPSDLVHSKLIILWGTNTRLTNRHLWPFIDQARAAGAQEIDIDPLRTITSDSADWFLQPLPGTDVALMLAMMHVLIRDGLVDHEWVAAHTVGFDDLAAHVAEWTPARAAATTGLAIDDIERLAVLYGTIRPAAIRTLIGAEHHEHGAMFFRTLTCLPALVGAWRDQGGGYARSVGVWSNEVVDVDALTRPDLLAGRTTRGLEMVHLGRVLTGDEQALAGGPPVKAAFMIAVNAMVSVPNTELVRRGLLRDDLFTVVNDQFLTDTARYADIVLPATTQIEATDVVTSWGHLYLGWNEAAIAPLGEAVSNSELHRRLAVAMGFTEPALLDDDLTVLRAALPTIDLEQLRADGVVKVPYPADGRPFANGGFPTPSGKVELRCDLLEALGQPALPSYAEPAEAALATRYPYALMTPKQHTRFLNSSYSHLPKHGPLEGSPFVELHATDAATLGLAEGQCARVWNDRGELQVPVRISERVRPGVVSIPWGWWAGQHAGGAGGGDGAPGPVANSLTNDTLTDWGGGVAFWDTRVSVAPA